MLGRSILAAAAGGDSRVFVYEVEGIRQSDQTANNDHEIRQGGTVQIQVPFNRMNEHMQRINRLGGRIVSIKTPDSAAAAAPATPAAE
jgi:phycocyanin-associated rod protein